MSTDPTLDPNERPAKPEQPEDGFAEGEANPEAYPEDERVGRFSLGEEQLGEDDPEKHRHGRFSEGQEELGEEDPEKHVERRFSEGQDHQPPDVTP
ncbi:MAG TPA: hypothetical protein VF257_13030 [Solirubrobacteraceae bacterium]